MSEPARVNDWIISQHVREGHTRDCFFPWDTVFIHADRTVRVCCTSAIVAKVDPDWDLEALMNGPELVEFRRTSSPACSPTSATSARSEWKSRSMSSAAS